MEETLQGKVALVTGAARRIGAAIARRLHAAGANVVVHYRGAEADALQLETELNAARAGSALRMKADLLAPLAPKALDQPEFCTHTPLTDNVDAYQTWCAFAYGYEITGDPVFLTRAEEMLREPLSTPALGSGSYGFLENRAALMGLVQSLYE